MAVTRVATTPPGFGLPQLDQFGNLFEYGASSLHVMGGQVQLGGAGTIWQISEAYYGPSTMANGFAYYVTPQTAGNAKSLVQAYVDPASLQGDGNTASGLHSPTWRSTSEPSLSFRNADAVSNPTTNFPAGSYPIALLTIDAGGRM